MNLVCGASVAPGFVFNFIGRWFDVSGHMSVSGLLVPVGIHHSVFLGTFVPRNSAEKKGLNLIVWLIYAQVVSVFACQVLN